MNFWFLIINNCFCNKINGGKRKKLFSRLGTIWLDYQIFVCTQIKCRKLKLGEKQLIDSNSCAEFQLVQFLIFLRKLNLTVLIKFS